MNDHYYDYTEDVRKTLPLAVVHFDSGPRDRQGFLDMRGKTLFALGLYPKGRALQNATDALRLIQWGLRNYPRDGSIRIGH